MTNVEAAAEAICELRPHHNLVYPSKKDQVQARAALDAIDPRLALLTPDDVTAILDYLHERVMCDVRDQDDEQPIRAHDAFKAIPVHVWEVLTR